MKARWMRHVFGIYPPYLGAGVRVDELTDDYRYARVVMPLRWYNRNYVGTHFGGSLFAMTDPFLMIMLIRNLGPEYLVWDKSAAIEYVAPGRGTVTAEFRVTQDMLDDIVRETSNGAKYLPTYPVEVRSADGALVARVDKQLYIRRKARPGAPAADPERSAAAS